MQEVRGQMNAQGRRFTIVVSRFNELVTNELVEGALDEFKRHGDPEIELIRVPGSWEIPPVVAKVLSRPVPPHGVVALGCILQGQTPHAKLLGGDVGSALMSLQVQHKIAVSFGILTPDSQEQALERAGMKVGNKGREAALAVIESASILEQI